ncbi:exonuclease domain-containing protein [Paraburkholderia lycopersici]|uniref:DNA-directed DNA polymerase n=1 Tax=Paraburkholderia lycopersici TaxID=416944 RepID=A0A1G6ZFF7_9BURK|nr:exonuclease domain-containing protein [Paraburkholderia lycopersici]SDE01191.1 DNA polymerase-3 subunit epsilon [Paraburkholderia lycopersici]
MFEFPLSAAPAVGDLPLVFVDLETTGGAVGEHRITEVGVVEVAGGQVTRWSTLVDPGQAIPPFIQQLTGITDAMVRGAPRFADIAAELHERLAGKLFIAHNAAFDRGFLRAEFERAGYSFNPDVLCTVRLSRALFPGEKRHGLDALVERHSLVPSDRHRALADADLLWQFWQRLPTLVPAQTLAAQIERTTRRHVLAGDITDEFIETAPAGHGVYAFYGESDVPLYVGRSVRVRQRVRAHLCGERRSAREQRMAQLVRRVEWRATGGELGALLVEAQWIAALKPSFNRVQRVSKRDPADLNAAPWPFGGAVLVQEQDTTNGADVFHVIDRWCYVGAFPSAAEAGLVMDPSTERRFELSTWRILQGRFERGLRVQVLQPSEADDLASPV